MCEVYQGLGLGIVSSLRTCHSALRRAFECLGTSRHRLGDIAGCRQPPRDIGSKTDATSGPAHDGQQRQPAQHPLSQAALGGPPLGFGPIRLLDR